MVGIDHSYLLIIAFRQHGDIILPQVMTMDKVDVPLLTKLCQSLGRLAVKAVIHGYLPGGHSHSLQPFHQKPALVVGKVGLHPSVGGEVLYQGLHIPLSPRLTGIVEQIQHFHHPPLPFRFILFYFTGKRQKNQPAFRREPQKRRAPGRRKVQGWFLPHHIHHKKAGYRIRKLLPL